MKKLSRYLLAGVLLLSFYNPTLAVGYGANAEAVSETDAVEAQNSFRQRVINQNAAQDKMLEIREKAQERVQTLQQKAQQIRAHVAAVHAERLGKRFGVYYSRLSKLIEKIESRMAVMAENGTDTSAAEAKVSEAKTKLEEAKSYADQAVAGFTAIEPDQYEAQRDQALAARDLAQKARSLFREVVALLKEAVRLLKAA